MIKGEILRGLRELEEEIDIASNMDLSDPENVRDYFKRMIRIVRKMEMEDR